MAETYGLEPNYGCCTANFNQGWPKFANAVVMSAQGPDGQPGAAVVMYAPVSAVLPGGSIITVDGNYPFDDEISVTLVEAPGAATAESSPFPVYLRIPSWAKNMTVDGKSVGAEWAGKMYVVHGSGGATTTTWKLQFNPEIRLESWTRTDAKGADSNRTVHSVHRGALMYSLPIKGNFTLLARHGFESNDYSVAPASGEEWNVALDAHPAAGTWQPMEFHHDGYRNSTAPFNHTDWPTFIEATVRNVPDWGISLNSAAPPPASPACKTQCGPPRKVKLVPHGGTDLRIGEMPLAFD